MRRLVFDIETAGMPWETLDEERQEYLLRFAKSDEERESKKLEVSLFPYTADTVCIGMLNVDSQRGEVLVNAPPHAEKWTSEDKTFTYLPMSEKEMLEHFWETVLKYDQLISFNGRAFDAPFLHIRSAILGVRASKNLIGYRYESKQHCDLFDQLTAYGATRKFSLDFICKGFGIDSPKSHGMTGLDVAPLFREGRFREIAEYNARDLVATRELFIRWEKFMNV